MAKKILRVFEGFAGYGGASFGLQKASIPHKVIGYSDIEQEAIELYEYNFPNIKNYGDITKIDEKSLPDFDLFTGGFPCQPFPLLGKCLGNWIQEELYLMISLEFANTKNLNTFC